MNCVVKTLVQSLVLLAIVISPVTVFAIQIPNDFESIPDALEDELVPQAEEVLQQGVADSQPESDSQPVSSQSSTDESDTPTIPAPQAESTSVAVAESIGSAELARAGVSSSMRVNVSRVSFSSPGKWHKKSPVSFVSHSPTVSLGSGSDSSSLCCDVVGGGDISSLMVFAQPRPFASIEEVGSLTQFIDSSAGFSQPLTSSDGQSEPSRASGRSRAYANSSVARGSTTVNRSPTTGTAVGSGACGCVGGGCGSEPSSNLIIAMFRMVTQFANCLISGD